MNVPKARLVPPPKFQSALVAFIDILGFSNRLRSAATTADLLPIVSGVRQVQNAFDYRSRDEAIKKVNKMYRKQVHAFSDCVVIALPLKSPMTDHEGTFDPLMEELTFFALSQGSCVRNGLFLRGGIDIGHWFAQKNVLVSPALANAYALEKEANVPVFTICEKAFDFFREHKDKGFYAHDPVSSLFKSYSKTKSKTTRQFLDYLPVSIQSLHWHRNKAQIEEYRTSEPERRDKIANQGYTDNCVDWLNEHKAAILAARSATTESSVREKYDWLIEYHNDFCESANVFRACLI
jgi:hypothetical protein